MTEVQALHDRLAAIETRHAEFEKVHVSRRGADGGQGPKGDQGERGPEADPAQVAAIAAEAVAQKFRHQDQIRKFEQLFKELEDAIKSAEVMVRAGLQYALITELKKAKIIDDKGEPHASLKGAKGDNGEAGSAGAQGSKGDKGDSGVPGRNGIDGSSGAKGDKGDKGDPGVVGPQGPQGLKGDKGDIDTSSPAFRNAVAQVVLDMKQRGALSGTPHSGSESASITKADLKELLAELKQPAPEQPQKKRGWFSN